MELMQAAYDLFMVPQHREYAQRMMDASNTENFEQVYQGFQSVPRPYGNGFYIATWQNNGSVHSPKFGEEWSEEMYETNMQYQVVLEFPGDMEELVGEGRLVVELEVDTREDEGWQEWVEFLEGPKYTLHQSPKLSWAIGCVNILPKYL